MTEAGLVVRNYSLVDEGIVVDLWRQCGLVVPWNDPSVDIRRKMEFQPRLFFVGELDGRIVGTVMAGYEGHRGWINYLAVAPDLRKMGIGRRLMEVAEVELRELGCQKINLQVRSSNKEVIAFYESLGFTVDDVISLGKRIETRGPHNSCDALGIIPDER